MSESPSPTSAELEQVEAFLTDELAAAALYRELSALDDARAEVFGELAATEERHAEHWRQVLRAAGREPAPFRRP